MRESGLIGFFRVVFETVRDGYSQGRAWLVISIMILILLLPLFLIAGLLLLIAHYS